MWQAVAIVGVVCVGCAGQSKQAEVPCSEDRVAAVKAICDVDAFVAFADEDDALERGRKRSAWLDKAENAEAIYLKTVLSVKPGKEQVEALRDEARAASLKSCALADAIDREELSALSP